MSDLWWTILSKVCTALACVRFVPDMDKQCNWHGRRENYWQTKRLREIKFYEPSKLSTLMYSHMAQCLWGWLAAMSLGGLGRLWWPSPVDSLFDRRGTTSWLGQLRPGLLHACGHTVQLTYFSSTAKTCQSGRGGEYYAALTAHMGRTLGSRSLDVLLEGTVSQLQDLLYRSYVLQYLKYCVDKWERHGVAKWENMDELKLIRCNGWGELILDKQFGNSREQETK